MRRLFQIAVPGLLVGVGPFINTTASFGKPEYAKATKKGCVTCHVDSKTKPKELTEAGKYFKEKKTLDGYTGK